MKVLQQNIWLGKIEGNLQRLFEETDYDVICLQEVVMSKNANRHLRGLFFDLNKIIEAARMPYAFFSPNWTNKIGSGRFRVGNLILSKIPFKETYSEFVNGHYNVLGGKIGRIPRNYLNVQIVKLSNGFTVVNHHGFWRSQPLGDEDTVKAFHHLAEIIKPFANEAPFVLCGDLNVIHEAPAMRELDFLTDLTYENKVKTTLSGLKIASNIPCDHIMINEKVEASDFKVHTEQLVSDHLGLSVILSKK